MGMGVGVVEEVEGVCQSSMRDPRGAVDFVFDLSGSCEDDEGSTTGGSDSLSFLTSPSPAIPAAAASLLLANALFPFVTPALEPIPIPAPAPAPFIPPNPVTPPALPPTERCCTAGKPVLLVFVFERNGRGVDDAGGEEEDREGRGEEDEGEGSGFRSSMEPMSGLWVCACCCAIICLSLVQHTAQISDRIGTSEKQQAECRPGLRGRK